MYLRYLRMKQVKFGANVGDKRKYYQDLLEVEDYLVWGSSIGCATQYPFRFEVDDLEKIRKKPTPLPKKARDWVNNYVGEQIELGVLREVDRSNESDPLFVINLVLVKNGQS